MQQLFVTSQKSVSHTSNVSKDCEADGCTKFSSDLSSHSESDTKSNVNDAKPSSTLALLKQ